MWYVRLLQLIKGEGGGGEGEGGGGGGRGEVGGVRGGAVLYYH